MTHDKPEANVIWIGVDDVIAAAERGIVALGPEVAGFLVLEATARVREASGGIVDAQRLAVGTGGDVALTAAPTRGDEFAATSSLRALLRRLLDVATSTTPALRQCARRGGAGLAALSRELEGALVPLNRSASRRAVVRVAKSTIDAANDGRLDAPAPTRPAAQTEARSERRSEITRDSRAQTAPASTRAVPRTSAPAIAAHESDVDPHVAAKQTFDDALLRAAASLPSRGDASEMHGHVFSAPLRSASALNGWDDIPPLPAMATQVSLNFAAFTDGGDEFTPYAGPAAWVYPEGAPPRTHDELAELAAKIDDADASGNDGFEVVTSLPPEVGGPARAAFAAKMPFPDTVDALLAGFSVSAQRDDRALGRDLKAMLGLDATRQPPSVAIEGSVVAAAIATAKRDARELEQRAQDARDDRDAADTSDASALLSSLTPSEATPVTRDALRASDEAPSSVSPVPRPRRSPARKILSFLGVAGALAAVGIGAVGGVKWARIRAGSRDAFALSTQQARPVTPAAAAAAAPAPVPAPTPAAVSATTACSATLILVPVPAGSEVARKLGPSPATVSLPLHVPFDLVAVSHEGGQVRTARRHIDATTTWTHETTQPHADVALTLDLPRPESVFTALAWPARDSATTPLAAVSDSTVRGTLRVHSEPVGAELWLIVDPNSISGLPCDADVDVAIVTPGAPLVNGADKAATANARPVHLDWSAFSGTPPHATLHL